MRNLSYFATSLLEPDKNIPQLTWVLPKLSPTKRDKISYITLTYPTIKIFKTTQTLRTDQLWTNSLPCSRSQERNRSIIDRAASLHSSRSPSCNPVYHTSLVCHSNQDSGRNDTSDIRSVYHKHCASWSIFQASATNYKKKKEKSTILNTLPTSPTTISNPHPKINGRNE